MQLNLPGLVIDRYRGLVFLRLFDVVNMDDIAKDFDCVCTMKADWRSRETDPSSIRQGLRQVARISGFKAILAPVRLVGDDDDIRPF
jgi:hypothetical protein